MIDAEYQQVVPFRPFLTPRQERFEERLARTLSHRGPRSEMREAVHQLVDHLRLQGVPAHRGLTIVMDAATRGARSWGAAEPGDQEDGGDRLGQLDYLTLVSNWAAARYGRSD